MPVRIVAKHSLGAPETPNFWRSARVKGKILAANDRRGDTEDRQQTTDKDLSRMQRFRESRAPLSRVGPSFLVIEQVRSLDMQPP